MQYPENIMRATICLGLFKCEHATDFSPPIYNIWKQQAKTEGSFSLPRAPRNFLGIGDELEEENNRHCPDDVRSSQWLLFPFDCKTYMLGAESKQSEELPPIQGDNAAKGHQGNDFKEAMNHVLDGRNFASGNGVADVTIRRGVMNEEHHSHNGNDERIDLQINPWKQP